MRGADDGPFVAYAGKAAQQELPEAARLLDLPEHRLGELPLPDGGLVTSGLVETGKNAGNWGLIIANKK
jgi:hypothetical protein